MAHTLSVSELRNMQPADIARDARDQRTLVSKLRLGIKLQKEKDTAKYRREKKLLSRMLTILSEKNAAPALVPRSPAGEVGLKKGKISSTISAPATL